MSPDVDRVEQQIPGSSTMAVGSRSGNAETVLGMMRAHREGRIDDMLAFVHPDVRWRPMFRPGLTVCVGRPAVRRLVEDIAASLGPYWFELVEVVDRPEGGLVARARIVLAADPGGGTGGDVEFRVTFLDGLMHEVATYPSDEALALPGGSSDPSALGAVVVPLGPVAIVVIEGVLADAGRAAVIDAVGRAVDSGRRLVQLECYSVRSVGPGGLEVLREAVDVGAAAGIHVQVLRPSHAVRVLLERQHRTFDVVD